MRKEISNTKNASAGKTALIRSKYAEKGSAHVTNAELSRYEKLVEQGMSPENAARQVFNEFRM